MPVLNIRASLSDDKDGEKSGQTALQNTGPLLPVTLAMTDETHRGYLQRSESPPPSVQGLAMIDTGALASCFDIQAATRAGLPIVGQADMSSTSHANQKVPVFSGKLLIGPNMIAAQLERAVGVNLAAFQGLVALIGRDLLGTATLHYNGPDGTVTLAV
jgi:hypothetical protein